MRCNGSNWAVYSPGSWDGFRNDVWALWAGVIMRLEHHLVGGYVRYISPHIIIIIMYMYYMYVFHWLAKKQITKKKVVSSYQFWSQPMTRNRRLGLRPKEKVSGFWFPRTWPQTCASAFLIWCYFILVLWNDVQLQPKLLDWLEFCHAVLLNDFIT